MVAWACVTATSLGSGDCDATGYHHNAVGVDAYGPPAGDASVGADTYSAGFALVRPPPPWIGAHAVAGSNSVYVHWFGYDIGSYSCCSFAVSASPPIGYNELGCPNGRPPAVPALLP